MVNEQRKTNDFSDEDYTSEESEKVFERAAQLQSQDTLRDDNQNLDRATLDKSAGRAGIDGKYVRQAVEELRAEEKNERAQKAAQQQERAVLQAKLKKAAIAIGVLVALFAWIAYSSLNNKLAAVERQQAQLENVLQRRHNLIPNLIAASKSATEQQKTLAASLGQLEKQAQAAPNFEQRMQAEDELAGTMRKVANSLDNDGSNAIFSRLSDEMAGAENRIATERKRYIDAVTEYNRTARGFPIVIFRPVFGFPAQKPYIDAEPGAREVPKF